MSKIRIMGRSVESLRREVRGPVTWQKATTFKMHCLKRQCIFVFAGVFSEIKGDDV